VAGARRPISVTLRDAWPLVGRADELDLLDAIARSDGSRSVVLAGPAGVGKSRLMADFVARAVAEGARAVTVRATRSTATIPFGPFAAWAPVVAGLPTVDRLDVLTATSRALLDSPDPAGDGGDQRADRMVVAIDDAHLLDDGSAALVLHLVAHTPAGVVLTVRSGSPCPDAIVALWKDGLAERADLEPLSRSETGELLVEVLHGPVEPTAFDRIWRLTEGTPLYLREVVRAALDHGVLTRAGGMWRWDGELPGSDRLVELVRGHLERVAPDVRGVAELLAFGEPLPMDLVDRLGAGAALADAEQQGFATVDEGPDGASVRLAHPLYGEVLRASAPALVARGHQRRLATVAVAAGWDERDPLRLASWWIDGGSSDGSAELFLTAASRAARLGDLLLAERLATASEARGGGARATIERAAVLGPLGRWDEAERLLAGVDVDGEDEALVAEVALARADGLFWWHGDRTAGIDVLRSAAARLGGRNRRGVLLTASYLHTLSCDPSTGLRLADDAAADVGDDPVQQLHHRVVRSLGLLMQGHTSDALSHTEAALPRAADLLDDAPVTAAALPWAHALALVLSGRIGEADDLAHLLLDLSRSDGRIFFRGRAATLAGRIALFRGDPAAALDHGREAWAALETVHHLPHWPAAVLATAAAQTGDVVTAEQALAWGDGGPPPAPYYALELDLARAWTAAARGEMSAARDAARDVAGRAADGGAHALELLAWLDVVRLGGARSTVARLDELAPLVDGAYAAAVRAYASALATGDGEALERTAATFEDMGALLVAAEAASAAAVAHRAQGSRGRERTALERGRLLVARCPGAATPGTRDLDAAPLTAMLTDREREVAGLAARGLTNRAIAERLFLSVRTVNSHLGRAYAKLGVSDRSQLAPFVAASRDDSAPPC
jgi:DNA-binding CsgD family transcriptional regulator